MDGAKLPEPGSLGDMLLISLEAAEPDVWLQLRDIAYNLNEEVEVVRRTMKRLFADGLVAARTSKSGHMEYQVADRAKLDQLRADARKEARAKQLAFREQQASKRK